MLTEIGNKYGKTAAQTALRFLIQNMDVFDFTLDDADMEAIQAVDEGGGQFC